MPQAYGNPLFLNYYITVNKRYPVGNLIYYSVQLKTISDTSFTILRDVDSAIPKSNAISRCVKPLPNLVRKTAALSYILT